MSVKSLNMIVTSLPLARTLKKVMNVSVGQAPLVMKCIVKVREKSLSDVMINWDGLTSVHM